MEIKIKKWGNSLGIRIPNHILKDLSLENGSSVDIQSIDGKIIIRSKRKFALSDLLRNINKDNIHDEFDTGDPTGKEIW